MLGFELKVVEAHGRRRRRKAQRHLTLLTDAVTSHKKTPPYRKSKPTTGKLRFRLLIHHQITRL